MSHEEGQRLHSMRSALLRRLLLVLVVALVIASIAGAIFLKRINRAASVERLDLAAAHYRNRANAIDQAWLLEAGSVRNQIIQTRLLESETPALLSARFAAYAAASSAGWSFTHAMLANADGATLAAYRTRTQENLAAPPRTQGGATWLFGERDGIPYRVIELPVTAEGKPARLVLLAPLDNAFLSANAFADADVRVLWRDKSVNGSTQARAPADAGPAPSPDTVRIVKWIDGETGPQLEIRTTFRAPLMVPDLLLVIAGTVLAIGVLAWFGVGAWMGRLAGRIDALAAATDQFAAQQQLSDAVLKPLQQAAGPAADEIRSVAESMRGMMAEIDSTRDRVLRAHAIVAKSESRYRSLLHQASDMVFVCMPDGIICEMNEAGHHMLGFAPGDLVGRNLLGLVALSGIALEEFMQALTRPGQAPLAECRLVHRDGTHVHVEIKVGIQAGGELLGIARDLREREAMSARMLELNASLEARVDARTAELAAVNGELETFAYAVSHDLRTPLRSMDAFSLMLLKQHGPAIGEAGAAQIQQVRAGIKRMGSLIEDLLDLSRVGRHSISRQQVDISAMCVEIGEDLRRNSDMAHAQFDVEPGIPVSADRGLMRVVLQNLLGNAFKYSRTASEPRVTVGRAQYQEGLGFFVRDNGSGFDAPAAKETLFKPFQRFHSEKDFEGTGIGLATVHRVINRHGGSIRAESSPGHGATFFVYLPDLTNKA